MRTGIENQRYRTYYITDLEKWKDSLIMRLVSRSSCSRDSDFLVPRSVETSAMDTLIGQSRLRIFTVQVL